MHEIPKYLEWVEAEHQAVEAAQAFFEAALGLNPPGFAPAPDAEEVAALRVKADTCYQAAIAELTEAGAPSPWKSGDGVIEEQLSRGGFVLLTPNKTVN